DAMNAIRGAALGCTYTIPPPPAGMMEDFNLVNVLYTPGGGGNAQTFPKVTDKAHCPANADGSYYDNNATPTQIILCDLTCQKVSMDIQGQIDISLGCQTVVY